MTGYKYGLVSVSNVGCRLRGVYYMVGVGVCTLCQDLSAIILFLFDSSPAVSSSRHFKCALFLIYFFTLHSLFLFWKMNLFMAVFTQ